jgi:nucleotide-binding universal stress UspA family protein
MTPEEPSTTRPIVAAFNHTAQGLDAIALAARLAAVDGAPVIVAEALAGLRGTDLHDRSAERTVRRLAGEARVAVAEHERAGLDIEYLPIRHQPLVSALHGLTRDRDAQLLVVGQSHLHGVARIVLGGGPELLLAHAPCPVAVASNRYRMLPDAPLAQIGVGVSGTAASDRAVLAAVELAEAAGARLRLIAVAPALPPRRPGRHGSAAEWLARGVDLVGGRVEVEEVTPGGEPAGRLVAESRCGLGMLVLGTRGVGTLGRLARGSVLLHVVRHALCPLLVVPPTALARRRPTSAVGRASGS